MTRTIVVTLVVIMAAAELLLVGLLLPSERWQVDVTQVAITAAVVAWATAAWLSSRQVAQAAGQASTWTLWPAALAGVIWGLLSGPLAWFAADLGMRWLVGLHGLAALAVAGLGVLMAGAGAHVDAVEAKTAATNDVHADLNTAISRARSRIARAGLEATLSQRVRIALERAQTVPRAALAGPQAESLLLAVREVAMAVEASGDVGAAAAGLEDVVVAVKGC